MRRQLRNFRISMSIVMPLAVFAFTAFTVRPSWLIFFAMAVAAVILWLISPSIWNDTVRRNIRRMARDTGLGSPGRHRLELNDIGLREDGPNGVMSTPWESVLCIDETDEHAFIYFGPTQAFVVPRHSGRTETDAFLGQVRRRLGSANMPA